MDATVVVRRMRSQDAPVIHQGFSQYGMSKSQDYHVRCWAENQSADRLTWIAFYGELFAGSVHLLKRSHYPWFVEQDIPEVNDFNVIPPLRQKGIGGALMDAVETHAFTVYNRVGLGVGLVASYGSAQRLYAKRGFIPDGRGLMYPQQPVEQGTRVRADHDLNLYLVKARVDGARMMETTAEASDQPTDNEEGVTW